MPSTASSRQYAQHVRVSSTEDLSYSVTPSGSGSTNEVIQTIVTGRKCWKTMKGKGEVVWPPHLEAALVQGLEKYRPVETRSTRALGRYPMRNKFISEYIFKITGKRRTPKQVGSRLQQLRDTCEGKRILKLLSTRAAESAKAEEVAAQVEVVPAAQPPCDRVVIDVLPNNTLWPSNDVGSIPSPLTSDASSVSSSRGYAYNTPRPLRVIDPTVTFRSASALTAHSSFRVLYNGAVVHNEDTPLDLRSSSCMAPQFSSEMDCSYLYSTTLVPRFWRKLCESSDPSAYTVVQDIIRTGGGSTPSSPTSTPQPSSQADDLMYSVVYIFSTHNSTLTSPPQSPGSSGSVGRSADPDTLSYSTESSPELGPEFDDLCVFGQPDAAALSPTLPPSLASSVQHAHQSNYNQNVPAAYDVPPDLIQDGDEGYASLPQSPLDFTFPPASVGMFPGMHPEAANNVPQRFCGNYSPVDETSLTAHSACYSDVPVNQNLWC